MFLTPSWRQVGTDGGINGEDRAAKHFGLILVESGPAWPGCWPAEAPRKGLVFSNPPTLGLRQLNE